MMALARLFSVACGPAREQTTQREGRKFRAQSSDRGQVRPTAEKDGRESRCKARRRAAAALLPANGVSLATSDPPSSRGSELPLLSYSYSALVSENMRKWVSDAKQNRYFGRQCWLQTSKYDQKSLSESPGPGNSASQRENGKLFPIPANHRRPSVLLEMAEDAVSPTIRGSWGFIPKIVGE